MASALRPIGHEDRLSIVDHLDELRSRLIVCGIAFAIAFVVCFWQNGALLNVLNRALPHSDTVASQESLANLARQSAEEYKGAALLQQGLGDLSQSDAPLTVQERAYLAVAAEGARKLAQSLPSTTPEKVKPITIGLGEPFTTTLTVAAYFAVLFSLPVLIYEGYAFVIPALTPKERRMALPVMLVAPVLFLIGVWFAYFLILPPAVHFLQGFNSQHFDILVQAKSYYTFEILTMLGVGLAFQLPLGLLALDHAGMINAQTLTKNWRYCIVIIAVVAATLPGADPVSTGLETLPLLILYLASIVLLTFADRRAASRARAELGAVED
jgi:sec-independent protein translocase protein TatC